MITIVLIHLRREAQASTSLSDPEVVPISCTRLVSFWPKMVSAKTLIFYAVAATAAVASPVLLEARAIVSPPLDATENDSFP